MSMIPQRSKDFFVEVGDLQDLDGHNLKLEEIDAIKRSRDPFSCADVLVVAGSPHGRIAMYNLDEEPQNADWVKVTRANRLRLAKEGLKRPDVLKDPEVRKSPENPKSPEDLERERQS